MDTRRLDPLPPEMDGERLDRALARLLPGLSRTRLQEWIRDGGVRLDGTPVRRPAQPVEAGQVLELTSVPRSRERRGAPEGLDLSVCHEDRWLAVVDKPAGMVVHPSSVVRGGTVAELAEARWGPLPRLQGDDRPGIVHRLDAETSGLMVIAREAEAGAELLRQFREREVEKRYLALVLGDPRFESDWIEAPLARAPRSPDRMSVVRPPLEDDRTASADPGRPASTFYEVVERFGDAALLACRPVTGRTHQIRVHLESIGHPVVADRLYTGGRGAARAQLPAQAPLPKRHALHAARLSFTHPGTGQRVVFEAVLPPELERLLTWLRQRATSAGS